MNELLLRYRAWLTKHYPSVTFQQQGQKVLEEIDELKLELQNFVMAESSDAKVLGESADVILSNFGLIIEMGYEPISVLANKLVELEAREVKTQ